MFSGMYIGATGMKTHSQGMSVLGNNIANVNTVAFKGSDIIFANLMSESAASAQNGVTGFSQIGMGVRVEDIKHDFSQGAFENTNTGTDLGITGKGFFRVHDDDEAYYTRAGNFNFNKEGYLVDPHGYRVQGTEITKTGRGSSKAIRLEPNSEGKVAMAGSTTTSITQNYNLGSGDKTTNAENPFFALSQAWNGQNTSEPLTSSQYDLANTIKVYDSNGTEHSLTVYLDEVAVSNGGDKRYWEYVVAMNPAEDGRAGFAGTEGAGLLMTGTMTFDSYGALEAMSAFTSQGGSASGPKDLGSCVPSAFSADGDPQFSATFSNGATMTSSLNMGLKSANGGWTGGASSAAEVGMNPASLPGYAAERSARSTTNYSGTSAVMNSTQNGYASGVMSGFAFNNDGVLIGRFTNGQTKELYQVDLYTFTNDYGLRSEGKNCFSATTASGDPIKGIPNVKAAGGISQYSLELSNVDLAEEFVHMIGTQRGFEANSKVITTSDAIIQNAINMKR